MQPTSQARHHALAPRRPATANPQDVALLAHLIGGNNRATTHAPMQPPGTLSGKYLTTHRAITDTQISAHLAGTQTHAVKLIGSDGLARAWAVDVDEGGAEAVRSHVMALSTAGLPCLGIAGQGATGHDGGHIWGVYAMPVTPTDARAQIIAALTAAGLPTGEVWPSGVHIRAPFGVHTHTGRRGALIRSGLPDVSLDTPDGLALGLASLADLAPSPLPPPLTAPTPRPIASAGSTSRPLAGKGGGTVRDVIAAFNQSHPIADLLTDYGAQRTRDGWACNCGIAHSHPTQLAETTGGNAIFFSPRCGWAPARTDRNGRPTADPFDLFTIVEHRGDKRAALRALRLAQPRRSAVPPPISDTDDRQHTTPEAIQTRQQDIQRQHEANIAAAIATLQAVRDRAAKDTELHSYPMAAAVLRALLEHAKNQTSCRPSKARIAAQLGCSERTVQRALVWLESRYIRTETFTTSAGHIWTGGRQNTPRRTFVKVPLHRTSTPQNAPAGETRADTPVSPKYEYYESLDSSESLAGEEGAALTPAYAAAGLAAMAWELWEWVPDAGDGGDAALPPSPALGRAAGADLDSALDAAEDAAILADEARILAYRAHRVAGASNYAALVLVAPVLVPVVPAPIPAPVVAVPVTADGCGQIVRVTYPGGACYDPHHDLLAGGVPWPEPAAPITPEITPLSAEIQAAIEQLTQAAAPPVYGPPTDPERRRKYFSLLGAARKAKSLGQRYRLQALAAALEEPQTQAEATHGQAEAAPLRRPAGQPTTPPFSLLNAAQAERASEQEQLAQAEGPLLTRPRAGHWHGLG